jgi:hypothetical protein
MIIAFGVADIAILELLEPVPVIVFPRMIGRLPFGVIADKMIP